MSGKTGFEGLPTRLAFELVGCIEGVSLPTMGGHHLMCRGHD